MKIIALFAALFAASLVRVAAKDVVLDMTCRISSLFGASKLAKVIGADLNLFAK